MHIMRNDDSQNSIHSLRRSKVELPRAIHYRSWPEDLVAVYPKLDHARSGITYRLVQG